MKKGVLVQPTWCRVWQWPAVVNLIMGGSAAGLFLTSLTVDPAGAGGAGTFPVGLKWAVSVLVGLGFSAVGFEAGRPGSAGYLLHHLKSSWMSREVLAGLGLVVFSGLDALFPTMVFKTVAGFGAIALLFCHGAMVNGARGATAWNRHVVVLHFFTSGISLGFGLLLIWTPGMHFENLQRTMGLGLTILAINLLVWLSYVFLIKEEEFGKATSSLRRPKSLALAVGLGHLLPALLLIVLLGTGPSSSESIPFAVLCILSGASVVMGGIYQKGALLLQTNLFRGIRAELCSVR